jgi:hypothetical protein
MKRHDEQRKRLTQTQLQVMKWLGKGWRSEAGAGQNVMVNGRKVCTMQTMQSLQKLGLVEVETDTPISPTGIPWSWQATESGKALVKELGI